MGTYSNVVSDCPACGADEGLKVQTRLQDGEGFVNFEPEGDAIDGNSNVIWADPETTKSTMGTFATCEVCDAAFQLRMLIVETMRLPMQFVRID